MDFGGGTKKSMCNVFGTQKCFHFQNIFREKKSAIGQDHLFGLSLVLRALNL